MKVMLLDDHSLFREGLARLLEADPSIELVANVGTAEEALAVLAHTAVDILIIDYDLGDTTALSFVRQHGLPCRTILVTAGLPNADALELLRLGVSGVIHKHQSPAELHRGILDVCEGKVVVDQKYMQSLLQPKPLDRTFTERERQILRLLLEGATNKELAASLATSESAIKASLQGLFGKTGVRTRSQLVRFVLEQMPGAT